MIKNLSHFENDLSHMKNVITQSLANGLRWRGLFGPEKKRQNSEELYQEAQPSWL